MLVKEKLRKVINEIEDEKKLEGIYRLISSLEKNQEGELYNSLTEAQKNELNFF